LRLGRSTDEGARTGAFVVYGSDISEAARRSGGPEIQRTCYDAVRWRKSSA
jgi:hypothetical protein